MHARYAAWYPANQSDLVGHDCVRPNPHFNSNSLPEDARCNRRYRAQQRIPRPAIPPRPPKGRSASLLQRKLLHPNWRLVPAQFDLPANSQIFARLAVAAGLHGILYPSSKQSGKHCMALFIQNWSNSGSFVEISDPVPKGTHRKRISGGN
jgi:hypothetical protein